MTEKGINNLINTINEVINNTAERINALATKIKATYLVTSSSTNIIIIIGSSIKVADALFDDVREVIDIIRNIPNGGGLFSKTTLIFLKDCAQIVMEVYSLKNLVEDFKINYDNLLAGLRVLYPELFTK